MGSRLQFSLCFESHSELYEDYWEWSDAGSALLDCMDESNENIVVDYARDVVQDDAEREKILGQVKKAVQSNKDLKRKYPISYFAVPTNNSLHDTEKAVSTNNLLPDETNTVAEMCNCGHKHDQPLNPVHFEPINWPGYFVKSNAKGFLYGKACSKCKMPVETTGTNRPSEGSLVYVCRTLMRTRGESPCSDQDSLWCNACSGNNTVAGCTTGRSRRSR